MEKWYTTNNYRELCIAILQENLVALRSKAKLSQDRMANLVGVSRQTYYGFETGNNPMSWTVCIALIFYFDKIEATRDMLRDLKVYPEELIVALNEKI